VETQVVKCRRKGNAQATLNGVDFVTRDGRSLLSAPGMCSAFQRVSAQSAGLVTRDFACCASATGVNLRKSGRSVQKLQRNALLVFAGGSRCSTCGRPVGHIVCYLGGGYVAENTSSGKRGDPRKPGVKISRLTEVDPVGTRLTGMYMLPPRPK
jgi:hypothetical protein